MLSSERFLDMGASLILRGYSFNDSPCQFHPWKKFGYASTRTSTKAIPVSPACSHNTFTFSEQNSGIT